MAARRGRGHGDADDEALGIGLAATQVGKSQAPALVPRMASEAPLCALINPAGHTWTSKEQDIFEEGCLPLQGVALDIERPMMMVP